MASKLRIHDTCGVHNLHGMPALISAIASAIVAALVTKEKYKSEMTTIFPAMVTTEEIEVQQTQNSSTIILGGYNRTASAQAGYQLFGIAMTVIVAIVGGILTGIVLKYTNVRKLNKEEHHQDEVFWEVPDHKEE
ncbi:ammonium transporter Rh type B-like [Teleopsis dalmanni]|nr:ammonium transporter Rh type B-like [Teleopsis dalmanni]